MLGLNLQDLDPEKEGCWSEDARTAAAGLGEEVGQAEALEGGSVPRGIV